MPHILSCLLALLGALLVQAQAAEVSVAVAANFTAPMQKIAAAFEQDSGHPAVLAFGSTGKFYAQIKNGAPFQVLLSADTTPRAWPPGLAQADTRFTYAVGRLVCGRPPDGVDTQGQVLQQGRFERLALADPKLAPYGAAALQTLRQRGVLGAIQPKIVQGENIAQTYQFIATGNAALGFVALSQVYEDGRIGRGSGWIVPETLHAPLRQDAIVLAPGKDSAAVAALMGYLRSERARGIIRAYGYGS
jgi:molybdate transport system substrate-binding protein